MRNQTAKRPWQRVTALFATLLVVLNTAGLTEAFAAEAPVEVKVKVTQENIEKWERELNGGQEDKAVKEPYELTDRGVPMSVVNAIYDIMDEESGEDSEVVPLMRFVDQECAAVVTGRVKETEDLHNGGTVKTITGLSLLGFNYSGKQRTFRLQVDTDAMTGAELEANAAWDYEYSFADWPSAGQVTDSGYHDSGIKDSGWKDSGKGEKPAGPDKNEGGGYLKPTQLAELREGKYIFSANPGTAIRMNVALNDDETAIKNAGALSFTPADTSWEMGTFAAFNLYAEVRSAKKLESPVKFQIVLPNDGLQLVQFRDGQYETNGYTITRTVEGDNQILSFEITSEGSSLETSIQMTYPNGVTAPGKTVSVSESDLRVDKGALEGDFITEGGALSFTAAYGWTNVTLNRNQASIAVSLRDGGKGIGLAKDKNITYSNITASSKSMGEYGGIYTDHYTLTNTLTLPAGISFPALGDGETVELRDEKVWFGGIAVLTGVPSQFTDVSFDGGRTLTLSYTATNGTLGEGGAARELNGPSGLGYTLNVESLLVDIERLQSGATIDNQVQLKATSKFGEEVSSLANVSTAVTVSNAGAELKKTGPTGKYIGWENIDDKGVHTPKTMDYTLTVRNTGLKSGQYTVTDPLPAYLEYVESTSKVDTVVTQVGYTNNTLTWDLGVLASGETRTITFTVKFKAEPTDNKGNALEKIVNTANVQINGQNAKEATCETPYLTNNPILSITKGNSAKEGKAIDGESIPYTITLTNAGGAPATGVVVTDILPPYLGDPTEVKAGGIDAAYEIKDSDPTGYRVMTISGLTVPDSESGGVGTLKITYNAKLVANPFPELSGDDNKFPALKANDTVLNSAYYTFGGKESGKVDSSVSYREKTQKVKVVKTGAKATKRADDGSGKDIYDIKYTLTVTNEGDDLPENSGFVLGDKMTGMLQPNQLNGSEGSWTTDGIWHYNNAQKTVTATVNVSASEYNLLWPIPAMEKGKSGTITYTGKVVIDKTYEGYATTPTATNSIYASGSGTSGGGDIIIGGGGGGGITQTFQPEVTIDKTITAINGKGTNIKSYEVHPGDLVTYTLTVKNTGNAPQHGVRLYDILPEVNQGSGGASYWELGDTVNVISGNFGGQDEKFTDDSKEGEITVGPRIYWSGEGETGSLSIPAGATQQVKVQLQFPSGAEFDRLFGKEKGAADDKIYNTFRMTLPTNDPEKSPVDVRVSHKVSDVKLSLEKTASSQRVEGGGEVTFTMSGFGTTYPISNLKLTDDLTGLAQAFKSESFKVKPGKFSGDAKDKLFFDLVINYRTKDSVAQSVSIPNMDYTKNNEYLLKDFFRDGLVPEGISLTSVEWVFTQPDLKKLTVVEPPQITMTAESTAATVTNKASVSYNDNKDAYAEAAVTVYYSDALDKTVQRIQGGSGTIVNGGADALKMGDVVRYTISYKNQTGGELEVSGLTLTDVLTTAGLKADTVTASLTAPAGVTFSNGTTQWPMTINPAATAPLTTTFKFAGGTLAQGEGISISYDVTVGESFGESIPEHNAGKETSYQGTENLHMLHNSVTASFGGKEFTKGTDFYYANGKDQLYFQKGVLSVGYLTDQNWGAGKFWLSPSNTSSTSAMSSDLDPDKNQFSQNMILYRITIYNDRSSTRSMTVESIHDKLPSGIETNQSGLMLNPIYFYPNFNNYVKDGTRANINIGAPSANYRGTNVKVGAGSNLTAIDLLGSIPDGVTETAAYVSASNYETHLIDNATGTADIDFTFKGADNQPLTLKPGEMLTFVYGVRLSRGGRKAEADKFSGGVFTNQASLNIVETGFTALEQNPGFETDVNLKNKALNDGGCAQDGNSWVSSTTVVAPKASAGIKKESTAYYPHAVYNTPEDLLKAMGASGSAPSRQQNLASLTYDDYVEWTITLYGGNDLKNVILTDLIPRPFEVIGDKVYVTNDQDGKSRWVGMETGRVKLENLETDQKRSQKLTVTGLPVYKAQAKRTTITILTQYKGTAQMPGSYLNTAYLSLGGRPMTVYTENGTQYGSLKVLDGVEMIESQAKVDLGGGSSTASEERITSDGSTKPGDTGIGNEGTGKNTIKVTGTPGEGRKVTYTLSITNTGTADLKDLVIIDRMSDPEDVGIVNDAVKRGSQFSVRPIDGTLKANKDISVSYKSHNAWQAYNTADWSTGSGWTGSATNDTNSIRIAVPGGLAQGETLTITFEAEIGDDAQPGEIAWNNFAYAYTAGSSVKRYAEPAMVGVELPKAQLQLLKTGDLGTELLKGAKFGLYSDADGKQKLMELTTSDKGTTEIVSLLPGTYYYKELEAPAGYQAPDGTMKKIELEESATVRVERVSNTAIPGSLTLTKVVTGDNPAPDREYQFTVSGPSVNTTINLKAGESKTWENLKAGTYNITEVIPSGSDYQLDGFKWSYGTTIADDAALNPATDGKMISVELRPGEQKDAVVVASNSAKAEGKLTVIKKLSGDTLEGDQARPFSFTLERSLDGGINWTEVERFTLSAADGAKEFTGLTLGARYRVTEKLDANGEFRLDQINNEAADMAYWEFIPSAGKADTAVFTNARKLGGFTLNKYLEGSKSVLLDGVSFELYAKDGSGTALRTGTTANGKLSFDGLLPGTYLLRETKAPDDYTVLQKESKVTLSYTQGAWTVSLPAEDVWSVEDNQLWIPNGNANIGRLTLSKAVRGDNPAPDQAFTFLVDGPGIQQETVTLKAGESKTWEGLKMGAYTITELLDANSLFALEGFQWAYGDSVPENSQLVTSEDHKLEVALSLENNQAQAAVVANNAAKATGRLTVTKMLSGAQKPGDEDLRFDFQLERSLDGGATWTVEETFTLGAFAQNNSKTFENLTLGAAYRVTEQLDSGNTPFQLESVSGSADGQSFVFTPTAASPEGETTFTNRHLFGSIDLVKYLSGKPTAYIQGVEFALYLKGSDDALQVKTTGSDGSVRFDELMPGAYLIREVGAPSNYIVLQQESEVTLRYADGVWTVSIPASEIWSQDQAGTIRIPNGTTDPDEPDTPDPGDPENPTTPDDPGTDNPENPTTPDNPNPGGSSGGGGGGGGGGNPTPPRNEIMIPDEPVPLSNIPDDNVPLAGLPRAGGRSTGLLGAIGAVLLASGAWLRRRKGAEDE